MSRSTIEVRHLRGGQPRPYADSVYEAEIAFKNWWDSTTGEREGTWDPPEATVIEVAKLFVRKFDSVRPDALSPYLKEIEKIGRGRWRVLIIEPYDD